MAAAATVQAPGVRPGTRPRRGYVAALVAALAALSPATARGIDAMDGGDRAAGPRRGLERLRLDLRPGGGLELSATPDAAAADGGAGDVDGDGDGPDPGPWSDASPGAVPLATPDWLRLSGTLEPSGLGLELGAAGLKTPEWHGLSGVWRLGLDAGLASVVPFGAPLPEALGAEYGLALPLTAAYGPLSLRTTLLEAGWRSGDDGGGLRVDWPPDTVGLGYSFPDPLAYLGAGEALTLRTEAQAAVGAEPGPLSVRGRLAWRPPAGGGWRPGLELDLRADDRDAWRADVGLGARLTLGRRGLLPGRHLELALEYANEDLLHGFYDGGGPPADQVAAVRLGL